MSATLTLAMGIAACAQSVTWITSSDGHYLQKQKTLKMTARADAEPIMSITGKENGTEIARWGTTFNERDWHALLMLSASDRDAILDNLFVPGKGIGFNAGRIGMNANDYALSWFSCDEVDGDFQLRYFNIDRDQKYIIPYIHEAQKRYPQMTFWISPWSPPTWMKVNHHYAVQSSRWSDLDKQKDYILFSGNKNSDNEQVQTDENIFPQRLATQNFMIQDPRYLQAYADYFCRFIDAYGKEGIPISMVMYQNEAYSYTPYPGCPWTTEGILRFNNDYLAPTLQREHPEVDLFIGTFNTNRYDHVIGILSDTTLQCNVRGVGVQWEGLQILPQLRQKFPQMEYICSESECGNGSNDWKAAEHTFDLINQNLGNGCRQYYNWNAVLCGNGRSSWGWTQNALVEVDSVAHTYRYTPEYYTYIHYARYIPAGSHIIAFRTSQETDGTPVLAARRSDGALVITAANFNDSARTVTIAIRGRYLNITLPAHSFHTCLLKC